MLEEDVIPIRRSDGSLVSLAELEAVAITYALRTHVSASAAARALGIGRSTLYRKMEDLGSVPRAVEVRHVPVPCVVELPKRLRRAVGCDERWQPEILLTA